MVEQNGAGVHFSYSFMDKQITVGYNYLPPAMNEFI